MQRQERLRWHLAELRVTGVRDGGRVTGCGRLSGGRSLRWPIARLQLRDRAFQGREQKTVYRAAVTEADFMLGRMRVDIDQRRVEVQVQYVGGISAVIQHIGICLTHGMRQYLVAHRATVNVKILQIGLRTGRRGKSLSLIHISEPTRRTPISYAVFCLKKKK